MGADKLSGQRIPCYCALYISRCGSIPVVENGRFVVLEPDPSHSTGKALCAKIHIHSSLRNTSCLVSHARKHLLPRSLQQAVRQGGI
jgi:hypothetical protein